jgi:hypothetical protein
LVMALTPHVCNRRVESIAHRRQSPCKVYSAASGPLKDDQASGDSVGCGRQTDVG